MKSKTRQGNDTAIFFNSPVQPCQNIMTSGLCNHKKVINR